MRGDWRHRWGALKVLGAAVALLAGGGIAAALAGASPTTTINWTPVNTSAGTFNQLACPTTGLCIGLGKAADSGPEEYVSTAPTGSAPWSSSEIAAASGKAFGAISCPSSSLCAIAGAGAVYVSTSPAAGGGGSNWTSVTVPLASKVSNDGLSCSSTGGTLCWGMSGHETVLESTTPGTSGAWHSVTLPNDLLDGEIDGVFCESTTFCAMLGISNDVNNDEYFWATEDPTSTTPTWHETEVDNGAHTVQETLICPATSFCIIGDGIGQFMTSTNAATTTPTFSAPVNIDDGNGDPVGAVDCPSSGLCIANTVGAGLLDSFEPTGPASAWVSDLLPNDLPATWTGLLTFSCPTATECLGTDGNGNVIEGVPGPPPTTTNSSTSNSTTTSSTKNQPPPPAKPSHTKITKSTIKKTDATFAFTASHATSFQCGLVGPIKKHHTVPKLKYKSCKSPKEFKHLKKGKYSFAVRGVNSAGDDPHPATKSFSIK
jgi:hypothetical protein